MTARGSALPRDDQKARAVRDMFDAIAPRYDLVNRIMTFGIDGLWRARAVRDLALPIGSTVVDIGCGTGDLCRALHAGQLHGIGVDMSWNMLVHARTGAPLVEADGLQLPFPDQSLDGAVSGFALRNVIDLAALFHELARVLRPLGRIALLDVAQPTQPLLRWGHGMYFGKVVPMIGAALSDAAAYRYLPESVAYLPAADRMVAMLDEAGFERVERRLLTGGITQLLTGTKACP